MWEVTYTISPNRGYFDRGELALWEEDIYFESILSMEFLDDGSLVVMYEVDGSADRLRAILEASPEKVIDYAISEDSDPMVLQLWFHPDERLQQVLSAHKSVGASVQFPTAYVSHDPATVEITETGPRNVLRERIQLTREVADISIKQMHEYDPSSGQLFKELTDRQQEVLLKAAELGYYRTPRETTHEEIAQELGCSKSMVGQHLRRIEARLVHSLVPVHEQLDRKPA